MTVPVFTRVSGKTMENPERVGRQARVGIELCTSRLPLLRGSAEPLATGGASIRRFVRSYCLQSLNSHTY